MASNPRLTQLTFHPVSSESLNLAGDVSVRGVELQGTRLYRGPLHCIGSILQTEGVLGLYRGAGAMALRDVPGYTLYFIPYTLICDWLTPEGSTSPHPCFIWLAGGLAGKGTVLERPACFDVGFLWGVTGPEDRHRVG